MNWRAGKVRRRLGIPSDEPLLAWAMGEYRGLRVPPPHMMPLKFWPPCVALTSRTLWLSNAGATRRYPVRDIVLVSSASSPEGALHVDFMSGDPLIISLVDDGTFFRRLTFEVRSVDKQLQMQARDARGVPALPPELVAAAERAERRAAQLRAEYGDDPGLCLEADRHASDARELRHEARVQALRALRAELLTSGGASEGRAGGGGSNPVRRGAPPLRVYPGQQAGSPRPGQGFRRPKVH
ncbi:MAG: hypothetical protein ABSB09_09620 [Acidimicrobiales bacterium]|jgi:hypothetical protein